MAHIPFTAEDDANLKGMARFARFAAVAAIATGVLQMITQSVGALLSPAPAANLGVPLCTGAVGVLVARLLGFFLFRVAKAVDLVVNTDDADQLHLVESLRALQGYFMVKGVIYILGVLVFCACFTAVVFFGAAALSMVGR